MASLTAVSSCGTSATGSGNPPRLSPTATRLAGSSWPGRCACHHAGGRARHELRHRRRPQPGVEAGRRPRWLGRPRAARELRAGAPRARGRLRRREPGPRATAESGRRARAGTRTRVCFIGPRIPGSATGARPSICSAAPSSRSLTRRASELSVPPPILRASRAFLSTSTSSRPLPGTTCRESNGAASCSSTLTDTSRRGASRSLGRHTSSQQRCESPPATPPGAPAPNGITDSHQTPRLARRARMVFQRIISG